MRLARLEKVVLVVCALSGVAAVVVFGLKVLPTATLSFVCCVAAMWLGRVW